MSSDVSTDSGYLPPVSMTTRSSVTNSVHTYASVVRDSLSRRGSDSDVQLPTRRPAGRSHVKRKIPTRCSAVVLTLLAIFFALVAIATAVGLFVLTKREDARLEQKIRELELKMRQESEEKMRTGEERNETGDEVGNWRELREGDVALQRQLDDVEQRLRKLNSSEHQQRHGLREELRQADANLQTQLREELRQADAALQTRLREELRQGDAALQTRLDQRLNSLSTPEGK